MPDFLTVAVAGAGFGVAQDTVSRVLGPTLDVYGEILKNYLTQKGQQNAGQIIEKADRKLEPDAEGQVPPRLLKDLLMEGAFCEDDIAQEYWAKRLRN